MQKRTAAEGQHETPETAARGLTIYECREHGPQELSPYDYPCAVCGAAVREVRVFREEDVRPLWNEARYRVDEAGSDYDPELDFPAPDDWTGQ